MTVSDILVIYFGLTNYQKKLDLDLPCFLPFLFCYLLNFGLFILHQTVKKL